MALVLIGKYHQHKKITDTLGRIVSGRSLTYNKNKRGHNIDP